MINKLGKEFEEACADLHKKMDALDNFIDEHPRRTDPATDPPELVNKEAELVSEYQKARDRFFITWNKLYRVIRFN